VKLPTFEKLMRFLGRRYGYTPPQVYELTLTEFSALITEDEDERQSASLGALFGL
jgi:hypothetical protein